MQFHKYTCLQNDIYNHHPFPFYDFPLVQTLKARMPFFGCKACHSAGIPANKKPIWYKKTFRDIDCHMMCFLWCSQCKHFPNNAEPITVLLWKSCFCKSIRNSISCADCNSCSATAEFETWQGEPITSLAIAAPRVESWNAWPTPHHISVERSAVCKWTKSRKERP